MAVPLFVTRLHREPEPRCVTCNSRRTDRLDEDPSVEESAHRTDRTPSVSDRRRVGLSLTREGQRVRRAVKSRRTAWLASRLRALSPAQLAAIDAAIGPLGELIAE